MPRPQKDRRRGRPSSGCLPTPLTPGARISSPVQPPRQRSHCACVTPSGLRPTCRLRNGQPIGPVGCRTLPLPQERSRVSASWRQPLCIGRLVTRSGKTSFSAATRLLSDPLSRSSAPATSCATQRGFTSAPLVGLAMQRSSPMPTRAFDEPPTVCWPRPIRPSTASVWTIRTFRSCGVWVRRRRKQRS